MIRSDLNPLLHSHGCACGKARTASAIAKNSVRANTWVDDFISREETDCNAACAELATSVAFNVTWTASVDTYKTQPDLISPEGEPWEVRWTHYRDGYLVIKIDDLWDPPDAYYWLVRGLRPNFQIIGCIWGREAKRLGRADPKLLGDRPGRPYYKIPEDLLCPAIRPVVHPRFEPPIWAPERWRDE